ncbi:MAG TPA: sporulation protein YunB [Epulopiscium sp.]|nr:sporulation protein YunB [Candidatus Epulonipiscium sp.]
MRKRNDGRAKIGVYIVVVVLITATWALINKEVMPVVRSLAKSQANMIAVKAINTGVNKTLRANKVTTQDLLFYDYNEAGEIVSWNVNSIRINELCTEVAEVIVADLNEVGDIQLKVPLGVLAGAQMFSNVGPNINIKVLPKGTANIDYKNQLRATGINQVNHVVWLEIELKMQIIIPLSSEEMVVKRKVVLVDKVISGQVPTHYLNLPFNE